jgi:hypothetical protein
MWWLWIVIPLVIVLLLIFVISMGKAASPANDKERAEEDKREIKYLLSRTITSGSAVKYKK